MGDSVWGKAKYDYYYTNYVDKDYPSKLSAKEESAAAVEEEEGRRIQKRILSTLDDFKFLDDEFKDDQPGDDLLEAIEQANQSLPDDLKKNKRKRVQFEINKVSKQKVDSDYDEDNDGEEDEDEDEEEDVDNDEEDEDDEDKIADDTNGRKRRPINMAIKKNRGLTPYKKKEFRNPRVKHKMKYKRAMSKRRRNVKEAQPEYHRYSGETTGIKTSTVKSIRLC